MSIVISLSFFKKKELLGHDPTATLLGMTPTDYIIILIYLIGIVSAGMVFTRKLNSAKDMFAAGGQSPWWVSGLSGFMTMFSAGTFVVWGGIAYRYGFVAVVINMCYGIAALLVGWFLAGRWRKLGVNSASEFLQLRFGNTVVQFYTWFQGTIGIFAVGGAIYALAKIVCALVLLPEGHMLADGDTGMLSVPIASIVLCLMVMLIACSGGLWAVLVTDVLQFVILLVSVIFVVPLILKKAGGWSNFITNLPDGFLSPVAADFTYWFLVGWIVIHFFKIGGEWGFVQRFTCVPTPADAKKSAFLFGILYLVSPIFWMLPALVFRVLDPNADFEQAYILACQLVLPAGMMGLMIAAMTSATASAATTQLNVFAGAFTTEFYQRILNPKASDMQLVFVGRIITIILGCLILAGALLIPKYGYTRFIIDLTTLITGPLVLPTIWGMFSNRINSRSVWVTTFWGFTAAVLLKFGLSENGILFDLQFMSSIVDWINANVRLADMIAGVIVPLVVLIFIEFTGTEQKDGLKQIKSFRDNYKKMDALESSDLPAMIMAFAVGVVGLIMLVLSLINQEERLILLAFAISLLVIALSIYLRLKSIKSLVS